MQVFAPLTPAAGLGATGQPFRWGPVTLHPHLLYRVLYGNGIASSPGQQHNTIVQQVSPGILFNIGTHWSLDYTPTWSFYSSGQFRNTLDHNVNLGWGTGYGDWFFHAMQNCAITSDPQVETGGQTDQQNYSTALDATGRLNDRLSLDLGLNQDLNFVSSGNSSTNYLQGLANSRSWSTMDWLNYQFWPRLNVGLGVGFGYYQQDSSPNAINEQYQARVNWRATDKISFQLSGGLQDQQYLSGGANDLLTPIFGATIQYQPFEQTRLTLNATRAVSPSAFQNQVTETTSISVGLNQRLFGALYLDLGGGYVATKYDASNVGSATSRSDDYYNFNARLTYPFLKRGTIAVFYQYSDNSSSQSGFLAAGSSFAYTSSQMGVELGYRY